MTEPKQAEPYLSVVVPLFNEEDNIAALINELEWHLVPLAVDYEIVLVDDGSRDGTWERIREASARHRHIKGVRLARNFGHQHALLAGLSLARGQAVVSLDGDLQHPPALIPAMLEQYKKGAKVVATRRDDMEVASFLKRTSSALFYRVFSFLTDVPIPPGSSDFRLLDQAVVKQLLDLRDVDLFLRGAVEWLGFPAVTVSYTANPRFSGSSKYTLRRMLRFAKGSIISFSTRPLALGIWLGILTSALAFLEIVYILVQVSRGHTIPGWASTVGIVSFLFGVLFVMLGIVGIYLARVHVALQNRPRFVVMERTDDGVG